MSKQNNNFELDNEESYKEFDNMMNHLKQNIFDIKKIINKNKDTNKKKLVTGF